MKTHQLFLIIMFLLTAIMQYNLYLKDKKYSKIKNKHHRKQKQN
ncbi:hypothetical protein [Deferribacter autotrophicus]|nr:hypothetical protein [Deferribacter autotrophicus]